MMNFRNKLDKSVFFFVHNAIRKDNGVMRKVICFSGQRVVLTTGEVATVAFVNHGCVYVFGKNGLPMPAVVIGDAWGGEHDQWINVA